MYKLIYFLLYTDFKKIKTNDTPAYNALIALVILQGMNFLTLVAIVNYFLSVTFYKNDVIYLGLIIFFLLLLLNYLFIYRNKNDIEIKYENILESKRQLYLWLYIAISVALFIFVTKYFVTPKY